MRKKPYTIIGLRRMKCFRCKNQANQQWQICSDDNVYRPLCVDCDIELNEMVLRWAKIKDWRAKMKRYKRYLTGGTDML